MLPGGIHLAPLKMPEDSTVVQLDRPNGLRFKRPPAHLYESVAITGEPCTLEDMWKLWTERFVDEASPTGEDVVSCTLYNFRVWRTDRRLGWQSRLLLFHMGGFDMTTERCGVQPNMCEVAREKVKVRGLRGANVGVLTKTPSQVMFHALHSLVVNRDTLTRIWYDVIPRHEDNEDAQKSRILIYSLLRARLVDGLHCWRRMLYRCWDAADLAR